MPYFSPQPRAEKLRIKSSQMGGFACVVHGSLLIRLHAGSPLYLWRPGSVQKQRNGRTRLCCPTVLDQIRKSGLWAWSDYETA
jgi:hypothetical protein